MRNQSRKETASWIRNQIGSQSFLGVNIPASGLMVRETKDAGNVPVDNSMNSGDGVMNFGAKGTDALSSRNTARTIGG